jgi:hypothetical protein
MRQTSTTRPNSCPRCVHQNGSKVTFNFSGSRLAPIANHMSAAVHQVERPLGHAHRHGGGEERNRKPELVAVPICGDMTKFLALEPRTSQYLFARGSKPIKDFRQRWNLACQEGRCAPVCCFTICGGQRSGPASGRSRRVGAHRTRGVSSNAPNLTDQSDTQEAGIAEVFGAALAQITSQK